MGGPTEPAPSGGRNSDIEDSDDPGVGDEPDGDEPCGWEDFSDGLIGGAVTATWFDLRTPGRVLAIAGPEVFLSEDSGATWHLQGSASATLLSLAFPAEGPELLLAASDSGLLESDDLGQTWKVRSLSGLRLASLLVHPSDPRRLFASVDTLGILRSVDGGSTWSPAAQGVPMGRVTAWAADADDVDDVVAGMMLFNEAGGANGHGAVLRTTNGGLTWATLTDAISTVHDLTACRPDSSRLWAATQRGVASSVDGGETWEEIAFGTRGSRSIAAAGADCDTLYVAPYREGISHSRDGGETWAHGFGLDIEVRQFAIDPSDAWRVLASSSAGLFHSLDGGETWDGLPGVGRLSIRTFVTSAHQPGALWLGSWGSGVWYRASSEASWEQNAFLGNTYISSLANSPHDPDLLLVADWPALMVSSNAGQFYEERARGNPMAFAFHPQSPEIIFAATQTQGVLASSDGGQTWEPRNTGLSPWVTAHGALIDVRAVHVDSIDPNRLYIGTNGKGLFLSEDGGLSWEAVGAGSFGQAVVTALAQAGENLYAGTSTLGVVHSADGGVSWQAIGTGLSSLAISSLLWDDLGHALYAATGRGLFVLGEDATWLRYDTGCAEGPTGHLAAVERAGQRWLVASGSGRRPLTLPLP